MFETFPRILPAIWKAMPPVLLICVGIMLWGFAALAAEPSVRKDKVLSIDGDVFLLGGKPFDMWGIRVASASQSDSLTDHLIAQLDDYNVHGVNTIDVFFQGSSGGFSDPFVDNGRAIRKDHLRRMKKIIRACERRGMVVIVGVFYQRTMADPRVRQIKDAEGVKNAVETAARVLRDHRNIILNIANEHNSSYYKRCEFFDFNDPQKIITLCRVARAVAPRLLVGAGGYHDESNIIIGKSPAVDVLLFDTYNRDVENGQHSLWHYELFTREGVTNKPIVNVEMFGGWTARFTPPGVYDDSGKSIHRKDVDEAVATPGLYVHFHSNAWCQGPSAGARVRYDLGGDGTPAHPGIRWWFEYVREQRGTRTLTGEQ